MLNLAFSLFALPATRRHGATLFGLLRDWARERIRYAQALRELRRLDDRDLDDIDIARADFPALAQRHAIGAAPLVRRRA